MPEFKQNYNIKTPNGERVYTIPGKNGPADMKIFSEFPKQPWPTSLYYVGTLLRLKGWVEDRNYPEGFGRVFLVGFIIECIANTSVSISDLCKKYKIPEKENE